MSHRAGMLSEPTAGERNPKPYEARVIPLTRTQGRRVCVIPKSHTARRNLNRDSTQAEDTKRRHSRMLPSHLFALSNKCHRANCRLEQIAADLDEKFICEELGVSALRKPELPGSFISLREVVNVDDTTRLAGKCSATFKHRRLPFKWPPRCSKGDCAATVVVDLLVE
jgi:hypothetical protein